MVSTPIAAEGSTRASMSTGTLPHDCAESWNV